MKIGVTTLGAARANGKSCILINLLGRVVMLDCGIDPSVDSSNSRFFPNFSRLGDINKVSCVVISHAHADHVGALPYLTEVLGYNGPIYMTAATKRMAEVVLEEIVKQSTSLKFSLKDVANCLEKIQTRNIRQSWQLPYDTAITLTFYPAGHVIGATMILLCGAEDQKEKSILYTGDFNSVDDGILGKRELPERYQGISKSELDILITETTFCNTIRESRMFGIARLLEEIHSCLKGYRDEENLSLLEMMNTYEEKGKRILIPLSVSSGRLPEFLLSFDRYLGSRQVESKVYFFSPLAKRYLEILQESPLNSSYFSGDLSLFDFDGLKHIEYWPFAYNDSEDKFRTLPEDIILITPDASLSHGLSKTLFKTIVERADSLVIFPGRCPSGTLGSEVINLPKENKGDMLIDNKRYKVNCRVSVMDSFSNHTDAKGILDLVQHLKPKNLFLVHGEESNMLNFSRMVSKLDLVKHIFCPKLNETKTCT